MLRLMGCHNDGSGYCGPDMRAFDVCRQKPCLHNDEKVRSAKGNPVLRKSTCFLHYVRSDEYGWNGPGRPD
jgi:hypothetical protein